MPNPSASDSPPAAGENPNRARDHLANERTFLAWVRTGVAIVVFGFAIGRFAVAIRQFMEIQGQVSRTAGLSVWFGMIAIVAGVFMTVGRPAALPPDAGAVGLGNV
jgi:uncharacterized membrane protein YidH (DUF202 family)